ncbi:hypothetical protein [Kibdelosporangium philippinense]|uniref:hypothetical protein n=1 Tax=Kibdelosporangium philippinense TaxID=211113 RepID=UPI00360E8CE9
MRPGHSLFRWRRRFRGRWVLAAPGFLRRQISTAPGFQQRQGLSPSGPRFPATPGFRQRQVPGSVGLPVTRGSSNARFPATPGFRRR